MAVMNEMETLAGQIEAAPKVPPAKVPLYRRILSLEFVCAALFVVMVLVMFVQVFTRYVFAYPLDWADEVVAAAFTWLSFLSAALAVKVKGHIAVEIVLNWLPNVPRKIVRTLTALAIIAFLAVLAYTGFQLAILNSDQQSAALNLPMSYVYLSLPVSAVLMFIYEVRHFIQDWKQHK